MKDIQQPEFRAIHTLLSIQKVSKFESFFLIFVDFNQLPAHLLERKVQSRISNIAKYSKTSITVLCLLGNYAVRVPQMDKVYQKGQEKPKSQHTSQTNKQRISIPHHSQNSTPDLGQLSNQQENQPPLLPARLPGQNPHHYTLLDSHRCQLFKWASYPGPAHHKYNYLLPKLLVPTFPLCLVLSLQKTDSAPVAVIRRCVTKKLQP